MEGVAGGSGACSVSMIWSITGAGAFIGIGKGSICISTSSLEGSIGISGGDCRVSGGGHGSSGGSSTCISVGLVAVVGGGLVTTAELGPAGHTGTGTNLVVGSGSEFGLSGKNISILSSKSCESISSQAGGGGVDFGMNSGSICRNLFARAGMLCYSSSSTSR